MRNRDSGWIEDHDGDLAFGFGLVGREAWVFPLRLTPGGLAFIPGRGPGFEGMGLGTDLSGHVRIGDEVVVPVGVNRVACPSCKHGDSAFAEIPIHHGVDALLAAAGSDCVQQKQRCSGERAADLASVGAKLFDSPAVPIVDWVSRRCHGSPFGTGRHQVGRWTGPKSVTRLLADSSDFIADPTITSSRFYGCTDEGQNGEGLCTASERIPGLGVLSENRPRWLA